ncbi:MAG: hypothetical protein M0R37_14870 [Bacteroidales bacterium]|jgi:hypothetical protein|nr:hypothetical protein [Candidatus Colwellbacteria bacterium]MCK9599009.1 hypothetical protein [Sphaerochaeta sp.]MCK9629856.1 hypothetical protein [Bacteroidales bacterium]
MKKVTAQMLEELATITKAARVYACGLNFACFVAWYFPHYVTSVFAAFHYAMFEGLDALTKGEISELVWVMFRESTKTTMAKLWLVWLICYRKTAYANVDSYDRSNAERFLFDVIVELQTNPRLIADFGQLYSSDRNADEITQKRVGDFVTNPVVTPEGRLDGIRVEAHSTQEPVRGRIHGAKRPDTLIMDDFEVSKTAASEVLTKNVREHISEFKAGLSSGSLRVLYLGNYLTDTGNVALLLRKAAEGGRCRSLFVPLVEDGKPTWPERWVLTDEEAEATGKISVERKKAEMRQPDTGDMDFQREMMLIPPTRTLARFRDEMFRPVTLEQVLAMRPLACFVTIDTPSKKEGLEDDGRDRCGITINWVTKDGDWHLKSWGAYMGPSGVVKEMVDLWCWLTDTCKTKPQVMAWEDTAFTRALEPLLKKEKDERKVFFALTWLEHKGRAKSDRIRSGLLHRYETGRVWHVTGESRDLEDELKAFPNGIKDDVVDSAAYQSDIVRLPHDREGMAADEQKFYLAMREKKLAESRKRGGSLRMA